jgi:hypothetical protein
MKKVVVLLVVSLLFAVTAWAQELPTITSSNISSTVGSTDAFILGSSGTGSNAGWVTTSANTINLAYNDKSVFYQAFAEDAKRYVQVFVVDPDKRVPVEQSILYKTEPFMTDLSDRELYFTIEVVKLLSEYNKKRIKMLDKEASKNGRDVYLETIKIRDLKMVVVNIATF